MSREDRLAANAGERAERARFRSRLNSASVLVPRYIKIFVALSLNVIAFIGCTPSNHLQLKLNADVARPRKSVVIFFVDGLDLVRLQTMLADHQLPNIQRVFVEGGVEVRDAVSSLPSVTYANCTSLITGLFPGHHGIMGNFWFDPHRLETRYYMTFGTYRTVNQDFCAPTLYELLDDQFTLNIQNHTRRGVTETVDNRFMFGLSWLLRKYNFADRYVGLHFEEAADKANLAKRWPSIVMTYYGGVDEIGHKFGSDSPEYGTALGDIDAVVGLISGQMQSARPAETVYYVLATDHSHVPTPVEHRMDMVRWLHEKRGLKLRSKPIDRDEYTDRLKLLEPYDAIGGLDEDRVVRFHLRSRRGWVYRPEPDEIEKWILDRPSPVDLPAVQFVLMKTGAHSVRVFSRDGKARIERRRESGSVQYRLINEEGDPLAYGAPAESTAFVQAGWHASREWLERTVGARYPDFVPQAVEMFDSPHTGDVVVMAADDWSLHPKQHGGHGSCLARDMKIPLYFAGGELPHGAVIGPGRLVDIMPTILGLLDEQQRLERIPPIDGINLADQLRHAKSR